MKTDAKNNDNGSQHAVGLMTAPIDVLQRVRGTLDSPVIVDFGA
ncbi:MAG: hypothetical protein WB973_05895 [Thermoanaerobaculia bacterium]